MDDTKRDQNKTKRSKTDHIRNVVTSYLQRRNYASTSASLEKITPNQHFTYSSVETAISKPNSILYSCYNSDPVAIDQNFTKFLAWVRDLVRNKSACQDIENLIAPLFCHLYLDILKGGHSEKAATFFKSHLQAIDRTKCDEFVGKLINLIATDSDSTSMREEFRTNKYFTELCTESVQALQKFVADNCHVVFLHILQNWFVIEEIDPKENDREETSPPEAPKPQSPKMNGGCDRDEFRKLREALEELEKEPKQIFVAKLANLKEPVIAGIIRRSCGLIAYNQMNVLKLRSVSQCDAVLGQYDCAEIQFVHHSELIYSIALSEDNSILCTGSGDKFVAIYDLNKMELTHLCEGHLGPVYCVSVSSNSTFVASGSQDTIARLWSTADGANLRIFAGHTAAVTCVDFHPNCLYLATGSVDKNLRLWSIDNGNPLRLFHGSKGVVYSVVFSPSGDTLVSGSDDRKLRVWDVLTSKIVTEIRVKGEPITRIACSDDSKLICGGSGADGTVKIWDLGQNNAENHSDNNGNHKFEPILTLNTRGKLFSIEFSFGTFACLTSRLQNEENYFFNVFKKAQ